MVKSNMTTNEEYKIATQLDSLQLDDEIITGLIEACEAWKPSSPGEKMPPVTVDDQAMPPDKDDRILRYKDMLLNNRKKIHRLGDGSPYKVKNSLFGALIEVWNCE